MATIAEFTILSQDGFFGQVRSEFPDYEIEIERLRPVNDTIRVYFWVSPTPTGRLENCEPSYVESLTHLDTIGGESLFRTDWPSTQESVLKGICKTGVILESATLDSQEWSVRLRAESSKQLSTFQQYCGKHGFKIRLTRFPTLIQIYSGDEFNLTEKQHEALILAYTQGYYEKPRDTTLEEIAEILDVTPPAVLARIQNGEKIYLKTQ